MDFEVSCQLILFHPLSAEQAVQYDDPQAYNGRLQYTILGSGHQRVMALHVWQLRAPRGQNT